MGHGPDRFTKPLLFGVYLGPVERLTEVFCGLVMVLTFTLVAGLHAPEGREGMAALLRAALGCNVAWGIIDGVVYLMGQRFARQRQAQLVAAVRDAADQTSMRAVLREAVEAELVAPMTPREAARVFSIVRTLAGRLPPVRPGLTRRDLYGAVSCFALCVGCALPAAVPFLLLDTPRVALRVSNAILLASLFALGMVWGRQIGGRPLATGLGLLVLGAAMVGIAVAFGG
jgi:VIT1/CCC1 family predicted Fe2+/Mn2+ transporter